MEGDEAGSTWAEVGGGGWRWVHDLVIPLFKRRLCFRNWSYHQCLLLLAVGDNNVMDEFIL